MREPKIKHLVAKVNVAYGVPRLVNTPRILGIGHHNYMITACLNNAGSSSVVEYMYAGNIHYLVGR